MAWDENSSLLVGALQSPSNDYSCRADNSLRRLAGQAGVTFQYEVIKSMHRRLADELDQRLLVALQAFRWGRGDH